MGRLDRCFNVADLRDEARRHLPRFMFEFVDRGSEDEVAMVHNREAFNRIKLRNRVLADISDRDVGTTLFGKRMGLPLAIAPTGSAGLCWHEGELALAKAAAAMNVPFTMATASLTPLEKIAKEAGGRIWFQTYLWSDPRIAEGVVRRAREAGCEVLIVTADVAIGSNREFNYRNGHSIPFRPGYRTVRDVLCRPRWMLNVLLPYLATTGMPKLYNLPPEVAAMPGMSVNSLEGVANWDLFARLRDLWQGPLLLKGVVRADDALRAAEIGADGVVVSNHGGRNMDSAVATIDALPAIVEAVGRRMTVILDSGIRRGSDMVKAFALGAKAVLLGRATLFGTAAGGQAGAERALNLLRREYEQTLAYVGCTRIGALTPDVLASGAPLSAHRSPFPA